MSQQVEARGVWVFIGETLREIQHLPKVNTEILPNILKMVNGVYTLKEIDQE